MRDALLKELQSSTASTASSSKSIGCWAGHLRGYVPCSGILVVTDGLG
jgi:hypothetical protein